MTALVLFTLAACGGPFPTATIDVAGHPVKVEIAADDELRMRGLMYRDSLGADRGMLFIYPDEQMRGFWMKNTRIPLDIAFADSQGRILWIDQMKPLDTNTTSSRYPAKYALEMNEGWFAAHSITVGGVLGDLPEVEAH